MARPRPLLGPTLGVAFCSFEGDTNVVEERKAGHEGLYWVFVAGDDEEGDD